MQMPESNEFVHLRPPSPFLWKGDAVFYVVGVNYLPSYQCGSFFDDYRRDQIRHELGQIAELGLNAVRVPLHWTFLEPRRGELNPVMLKRFEDFLTLADECDLHVMPWLAGVNVIFSFPDYQRGKSLYSEEMTDATAWVYSTLAGRFREDTRILAWDLFDEPYFYESRRHDLCGGDDPNADPRTARMWVTRLYQSVKQAAPNHLITLGLHFALPQLDHGFHPEGLVDCLDVFGPGGGPGFMGGRIDTPRNTFLPAFITHFHAGLKATILSEAPMTSSVLAADTIIAGHFSSSLPMALGVGGAGAMPWVAYDFSSDQHQSVSILESRPHEACWGIMTADGKVKPQGEALSEFAKAMSEIDLSGLNRCKANCALIIPSRYYDIMAQLEAWQGFYNLYGGYILAHLAGITCDLIREDRLDDQELSADQLLIASSTHHMKPATCERLLEHVKRGGKALMSYSWNECLTPLTDRLFGIETQWFWQPAPATSLDIGEARMQIPPLPRLAVSPTTGEVLASFADGFPAVVANDVGQGRAILITFPLERLFMTADVTGDTYHDFLAVYRFVFESLGITPQIDSNHGAISIHAMDDEGGRRRLIILVNHESAPARARLRIEGWSRAKVLTAEEASVATANGERQVSLDFEPNGYHLLDLHR